MSEEHEPSPTRWWTLGIVSLGTFMLMLDLSVVAIALPKIHEDLDSSFTDLQWVFDAYALTLAIFLVAAGSLADRYGRKRVFQIGFLVFTTASLACGLAADATALSLFRAVQGVGAAVMFAVGPAMLGHEFRGKERATAFTVFGAAVGLAVAAGPLIGGALTESLSWRWIFYINVPVGIAAVVIGALRVAESYNRKAPATDWTGLLTFSVALGALVFAIIRAPLEGWTSAQTVALFAASAVFLALFVVIERRLGDRAMIDLGFFRSPTFVGISLVAMIGNAAVMPSIFIETSYLENILRYDAWDTGLRFLPLTGAMFVTGALAGGLIGKVPFRVLLGGATAVMAVGLYLLRAAEADSAWTVLLPSMLISGIGMGAFNPARAALAIGVAEPAKSGVVSGINETFQQIGVAVGIAATGAFFQHRVADEFAATRAGEAMGADTAEQAAHGISAGAVDAVAQGAGALREQVLADGRESFVAAFQDAMALCAGLGFLAALLAFTLLRTRDLHASALSSVPPEPAEAPVAV
ncbi:putative multidrug resistance protein MdtD [Streptomyces sp. RB5]|uniref:Putative multidrug resistance protein MdtD n=1 Tax=Streptomyces smaragdinus TaxID=2585196 RepID=A0A7K0CTT0_9ACTN|nr:MFS transporter [Streptomyces smaragdinus]MQY16895.1 putative multidrug resistance protein MdtD [Streptomyces smaragdinus]